MKKYLVYVLESIKDQGYYIGVTSDVSRRLREHNAGLSRSTKPRRPWKLVYQEEFPDIRSAYRKEKHLKSFKKQQYLRKLIKYNLPR